MKLENSTKDWYVGEYFNDDFAFEVLDGKATFKGLLEVLERGEDIYQYLFIDNKSDSIIRERMFSKLAELMEVGYEDIYNKWVYIPK